MILATSSNQEILDQVGMSKLFTRIIHVPQINSVDQISKVLEKSDFTNQETQAIAGLLQQGGYK